MTIKTFHDHKSWERFFLAHKPEALFQSWEWGETIQKTGSFLERFGMWDGKRLLGIFQIVRVSAKRGTFLHVRHGPILSEYSRHMIQTFTDFMREKAKQEHALFFRVSPLIDETYQDVFLSIGYKSAAIHAMDGEVCWVVSLEPSLDLIYSSMRKTTRYEIRKAQRVGVRVYSSNDLSSFFSLYDETSKRRGFVQHGGIQEEFEVFSTTDKAKLYYAEYEKKIIASAIILFIGNQGIYHHGASVHGSPSGAHLIQWEAIQEAKHRGMQQYNFWGIAPSGDPRHPWVGITLFKKGFGGEERRHLHAQDYPVSPLYVIPRAIEMIRKIRKGY